MRSTWDVYLDGRTLTWIRGSCSAADTARRFFVRYYPADAGNLNGSRGRSRGYNDTGFGFTDRGLRYEGKCMASFDLPAYAVTRIVTGQYDASGHTWEGDFTTTATATTPATATATDATATGAAAAEASATASAPPAVRYNKLDATGAVTAAGSYAFLDAGGASGAGGAGGASGASGSSGGPSVITTWEDLRSEATTLRVHQTDAGGASQTGAFGAVAAGDIMEWRKAGDCWVRYRVTAAPTRPASGSSRWVFPVERLAYAATGAGCTGAVAASTTLDVDVDSSAVIRASGIASPVRYGPYLLYPSGWTGALEARAPVSASATGQAASGATSRWPSDDSAVVRQHPLWNDPDVPDGWTLGYAWAQSSDRVLGFYNNADDVHVLVTTITRLKTRPAYHLQTDAGASGEIYETRIIDGRPALLKHDPARSRRSTPRHLRRHPRPLTTS